MRRKNRVTLYLQHNKKQALDLKNIQIPLYVKIIFSTLSVQILDFQKISDLLQAIDLRNKKIPLNVKIISRSFSVQKDYQFKQNHYTGSRNQFLQNF